LGSDFEAVDESSLMLSPDSGQALQADSDSQSPTAPTGLAATVVSSGQISLSWNASVDNVGVDGYAIYRNGARIATTANLVYQSLGLTASTSYTYRVAAYDAAGNLSPQSAAVTATTLPLPSKAFKTGDHVQSTEQVGIRSAPSEWGTVIGVQPKGASGTVAGGPEYWSSQWWWSINFSGGSDGWVMEAKLKKASRPARPVLIRSRTRQSLSHSP
jgi:chitodextrinase